MNNDSKILILDTNQKTGRIIQRILEEHAVECKLASDKNMACDNISEWVPHLIIVDISTIEVDGFDICDEMKNSNQSSDIPIIYVASQTNSQNIIQAFKNGVVDYIVKPFEAEEFIARVDTHLQLVHAKKKIQLQNEELQELNAIKNKLFSIIAHDLRGPLGNFRSILDIAIKHISHKPETISEILHAVRESAHNTYSLLENLLHWSRAQQNKIKISPTLFNLNEVVFDSIELFKYDAYNKQITINNILETQYTCLADKDMIFIVLRNLLSNALKFTSAKGIIEVSVERKGSMCEIAIQDSGVGMSDEKLKALFNTKQYGTTWGTNNEMGTGLGLHLCSEILSLHGQKLTIVSEEGNGTRISFALEVN